MQLVCCLLVGGDNGVSLTDEKKGAYNLFFLWVNEKKRDS